MLDHLLEQYPLTQMSQPLTTDTFGCMLHDLADGPRLIDFRPAVLNGLVQFNGVEEPDITFTFQASVMASLNPAPRSIALCIFLNEGLFPRRNDYLLAKNQTKHLLGGYVVSARFSGGISVEGLQDPVDMSFVRKKVRLT